MGHSYSTNARSAWADLPSTRFLNEIGNAPAASLPSRLPFRSYICAPTRTAILAPSRFDPRRFERDGENLPRVRIKNDVLSKDEILSHGFWLEDDG